MKPSTAKNKATTLHSLIVRSRGVCEARGWYGHECSGKLECAHIISRRYSATRTRLDNAFCLCSKAHFRFSEWPVEFAEFVAERIGPDRYQALQDAARSGGKVDWFAELERLQQIAAKLDDLQEWS